MPRSVYIIDGHAQIFRAYYAPFPNLNSPTGEPTRATHVFFQMLLNLVRVRKPDYLAMALDVSDETTFRKGVYKEYKAHRDPPPEDLEPQIERIISILEAIRMPILRVAGYEADDLMATLATRLGGDGGDKEGSAGGGEPMHVYLVSRDKDLDQVLGPNVSLYDPTKSQVIGAADLLALKGWTPAQAIEVQCLMGDNVDNVPGVHGIGPKTAAKLIQKYGTAKAVIEHAAELTPRQRDSVLAFAPLLETTRKLVTLVRDAPIELNLEDAAASAIRWAAARSIFRELGFRKLTEQLPKWEGTEDAADIASADCSEASGAGTTKIDARSGSARPLPARLPKPAVLHAEPIGKGVGGDGAEVREGHGAVAEAPTRAGPRLGAETSHVGTDESVKEGFTKADKQPVDVLTRRPGSSVGDARWSELTKRLVTPVRGTYHLIDTRAKFERFVEALSRQWEFALDSETTDVNAIDADPVGLSFAWCVGEAYYLPLRAMSGDVLPLELVREMLSPILADPKRTKVGQNIKYDLIVLRQSGMPVSGPLFDTMVASFVIDSTRRSHGIDSLVAGLFGHQKIPTSDLIGKGSDQLRMDQVPVEHVCEYACEDADYTWRLKELFEAQLAEKRLADLFYKTEMPLVEVLAEMEFNGITIDAGLLRRMSNTMASRVVELSDEVQKLAGVRFNPDSPKQLGEVLFDRLGLRVVRKTKTGRSTDAETLETLAAETRHPVPTLLLEYRELQKLRGTYVDALPRAVSRRTGRIHTSFHQTGAVTGRLSSSEPNLQNIPIRSEAGREIRRAFVPRTTDDRLIVADYSQIELRMLAHFCRDEALIRAFVEDLDIHTFVASQVNGVPLKDVTKEMRSRAKAVNFGIIYGQTAFGLARGTGMSQTDAQKFIDDYFGRYPRIREFIEASIAAARRDGFVTTILGRRREISGLDSRNRSERAAAERFAVNTVIQGSAADLIKTAMNRLYAVIVERKLALRMLLQVHDELVCESPASEAERHATLIAEIMSGAIPLSVPVKVDAHVAKNWLEAK